MIIITRTEHLKVLPGCGPGGKILIMLKYIYATIITAVVSGILIACFPGPMSVEGVTVVKVLYWVIIVMVWASLVGYFSRREKKKRDL